MDEKKEQPDENSSPCVLQLVTGTGKVLWQQSLPSLSHQKVLGVSAFSNERKFADSYWLRVDLNMATSPDSSS